DFDDVAFAELLVCYELVGFEVLVDGVASKRVQSVSCNTPFPLVLSLRLGSGSPRRRAGRRLLALADRDAHIQRLGCPIIVLRPAGLANHALGAILHHRDDAVTQVEAARGAPSIDVAACCKRLQESSLLSWSGRGSGRALGTRFGSGLLCLGLFGVLC